MTLTNISSFFVFLHTFSFLSNNMSVKKNLETIKSKLPAGVTLVAVSKTHPPEAIMEARQAGQVVFGESRPQEMAAKYAALPHDIQWHMIGHLQTNKVKTIAPFVSMIQSVDSEKLLRTIDSEAVKNDRAIDILIQIHIAREESKSGWRYDGLRRFLDRGEWHGMTGVVFRGVMGISTNTDDRQQVMDEFDLLRGYFVQSGRDYFDSRFDTLSMGMSGDWPLAVECGSNMVRVGSAIFGDRDYL